MRAEDEVRTRDPQLGRLMLYRLSYFRIKIMVGAEGVEPATPGVTGRYSNQLNYRTNIYLCVWLVLIRLQIYGK